MAPNVTILARAYAYRDANSIVYVIYRDSIPMGLLMQRDYYENGVNYCVLDHFMIEAAFQGQGYGKVVMKQWIALVTATNKYDAIMLCYHEEDVIAKKLYLSIGFTQFNEVDDEEITMIYSLNLTKG